MTLTTPITNEPHDTTRRLQEHIDMESEGQIPTPELWTCAQMLEMLRNCNDSTMRLKLGQMLYLRGSMDVIEKEVGR